MNKPKIINIVIVLFYLVFAKKKKKIIITTSIKTILTTQIPIYVIDMR